MCLLSAFIAFLVWQLHWVQAILQSFDAAQAHSDFLLLWLTSTTCACEYRSKYMLCKHFVLIYCVRSVHCLMCTRIESSVSGLFFRQSLAGVWVANKVRATQGQVEFNLWLPLFVKMCAWGFKCFSSSTKAGTRSAFIWHMWMNLYLPLWPSRDIISNYQTTVQGFCEKLTVFAGPAQWHCKVLLVWQYRPLVLAWCSDITAFWFNLELRFLTCLTSMLCLCAWHSNI